MSTSLPNTIINSWRSSLSQQHSTSLRSFFSSNSCLRHQPVPSNTFFTPSQSSKATSSFGRWSSRSPLQSNSTSNSNASRPSIASFQGVFNTARLLHTQKSWTSHANARSFSVSSILRAARPNWYAGRQVETVRAGPIKKLQWAIDRKVPKVSVAD